MESRRERIARQTREGRPGYRAARSARTIRMRFFGTRKRTLISLVVLLGVPMILVQLFYPPTSVLPNIKVGAVSIGGMSKEEAAEHLDKAYLNTKVPVYFSDSDEAVITPTQANLGFSVDNEARVDAYSYPFFWRLVPTSLFWYQLFMGKGEPAVTQSDEAFNAYMAKYFGDDCEFGPQNATIVYTDDELQVVDAIRGGSCDINELRTKLRSVTASLTPQKVEVEGTSTAPAISTKTAQTELERLEKELGDGIELTVEKKKESVPKDTAVQWVVYSADSGTLVLGLNGEKASAWLNDKYKQRFTSEAGTTVVALRDYAEASRETGKDGRALNTDATINEMIKRLKGDAENAKLVVDTIKPNVTYTRSYSPSNAKISAVMKNYADTHAGVYGAKMVELSGSRRNAEYNANHIFTTASTYKMFVAYSILLRIERGEISWDDPSYGGLSVSTCFDRMIKLSNNECAVWFLLKVSYDGVTADAHAIGATHTNFVRSTGIKSNAADEAHFLSLLYTGQILSQQASRDRLIAAMKGNVYVAGIPTGIPNTTIADKVGFLDGLLHDAAIVYSSTGDYVLIIMTDNASWANIAELAGQIEAARAN